MTALFMHCRPGFEAECAAEIQDRAAGSDVSGFCKAKPQAAYAVFQPAVAHDAERLHEALAFGSLIFARQWFVVHTMRNDLPVTDRVTAMVESMRDSGHVFDDLFLETPDTNEGKALSGLCRSLDAPLRDRLRKTGLLSAGAEPTAPWRMHACLLSGTAAYLGYARHDNSAAWPMGIPRLRLARAAPSRAALKLEEALMHFLGSEQHRDLLRSGMRAVDLGAAPGGWTWQLIRNGLHVTAVDNASMDQTVLESGLVEHRREDGFRFRPEQPVDWMVCDMVEQPARIAALAAQWVREGWCRHTIFNLKLPMKKRYQEVQRCLEIVRSELSSAGIAYHAACKQLYHDREEVTVFLRRTR